MVLYGIILAPLADDLRDADPTLLTSFYANDAAFDRTERQCVVQLKLLMDLGPGRGYFPKTDKSLVIADNSEGEEAERRKFEQAGINLNYVGGS